MAIFKFDNKAAYDAATKSTTESTVSLIKDSESVVYDNVNVIVSVPEVGDILFLDVNNERHFLKHDTYNSASFPAGCTFVGVVFDVHGNNIKIINKTSSTQKWAEVYQWKVTGWTLDSTNHSGVVTLYNNTAFGTFTYNASTLSDCATQLNAWLASNAPNYTCYLQGTDVILQWNAYTAYPGTHTIAGLTLTPTMGDEVSNTSTECTLKTKRRTSWGGVNLSRFVEYFSASGTVPTSNIPITSNTTVNKVSFETSDYCVDLRAKWSTYKDYCKDRMAIFSYPRGVMSFPSGLSDTLALANVTYTAADGSTKYKYPAAHYCNQIAYNHPDMVQGKWYLGSILEYALLVSRLTYGLSGVTIAKADVINRSLNTIGGTLQDVSSNRWSVVRYSSLYSWFVDYAGGVGYSNLFYYAFMAVPVLALTI